MRVAALTQSKNHQIHFTAAMPTEYGGVQVIVGTELYNAVQYAIRREIVDLFVIADDEACVLIACFIDEDEEENLCGFSAKLTPEEYHTYLDLIG